MSFYFFILAMPRSMQDLRSPTRDLTLAPCSGSTESTTGPPGKSTMYVILYVLIITLKK